MSFKISSKKKKKVKSKKIVVEKFNPRDLVIKPFEEDPTLLLLTGTTLFHSANLVTLGGKYRYDLSGGPGWLFPKIKEIVLKRYIETGSIESVKKVEPLTLSAAFQELKDSFDPLKMYRGSSILTVINKIEKRIE